MLYIALKRRPIESNRGIKNPFLKWIPMMVAHSVEGPATKIILIFLFVSLLYRLEVQKDD